jgi:2-polyprenyl-3-methyl-5-hydroxy-6-metoxy-1,4-benzoquinol methylase
MKTFNEQSNQYISFKESYKFPVHYIHNMDENGDVSVCRTTQMFGYEHYLYNLHIKEMVKNLNPGSLLDVGCGDGKFINMMKGEVKIVKGVDMSTQAIDFANAFYNVTPLFLNVLMSLS